MRVLGWKHFNIYKSFGVNEFIEIQLNVTQKQRANKLFNSANERIKSKRDIEDLKINDTQIGDLIYDTFLKKYRLPTININDSKFKLFLLESLKMFVFWEDYLLNNNVKGLNVSHCVYNLAIPLRIAIQRNIDVFQINVTHMYRLNKYNYFAYNDFFYFREKFCSLPTDLREAGVALAEKRIQRRFSGEVGVDMSYSKKSAYGSSRHNRLIRESLKKKILIATHCFFDSPHGYGKNIFPDFYEWLDFLGKTTLRTNYDWYIKTHPDYLPGTKLIIDEFIHRYPKFTLLPSDASHLQIIDEGIDVALTTYGTIGFEYAALGVPVINASQNNPHIAYNFNIHAIDVEHYRSLLESLENFDFHINKNEVYEYYFMRFIYNSENLFFKDYANTIKKIGCYKQQFTPVIYKEWLAEWSPHSHEELISALDRFTSSNKFRMDYDDFGREISGISLDEFL